MISDTAAIPSAKQGSNANYYQHDSSTEQPMMLQDRITLVKLTLLLQKAQGPLGSPRSCIESEF
ncbi:MAG: hypothetical protein M3275_14885 [Thermoproteota archaeon]|nr:hypothetical protein [Thermoproteota archaeon]